MYTSNDKLKWNGSYVYTQGNSHPTYPSYQIRDFIFKARSYLKSLSGLYGRRQQGKD